MIREVAILTIDPARATEFEGAVAEARPYFESSEDCLFFTLERVIETPGSYRLVVGWTSVEAHIERFRASAEFQKWRDLAGPFFVEPPVVVHTEQVI
ncbi:putative quinol monooxygenase [Histidinibacterium aquaticum]|uniref:Antibiotic biosynthesis monooxygenase n=1 Tax=Histidinibacterium aquaticum TaxID=2613962 RepID=A0A5J5GC50_9RHOB|nr:antibiotic biosynthesis monooxygenase family protein [Histidinibacterium aquaticum]KAA9005540.1 antibiotic biosynthesis monooxygenase [Histidinibacterium aquaticum]